jgi:hypothetical protein
MADDRLACCRLESISVTRAISVILRATAISLSPSQNASSRLTLVLRWAIKMECLLTEVDRLSFCDSLQSRAPPEPELIGCGLQARTPPDPHSGRAGPSGLHGCRQVPTEGADGSATSEPLSIRKDRRFRRCHCPPTSMRSKAAPLRRDS